MPHLSAAQSASANRAFNNVLNVGSAGGGRNDGCHSMICLNAPPPIGATMPR